MMFPSSRFLWKVIPQLSAIQFPYRFNTLLTIATVALTALAADSLKPPFRAGRIMIATGIVAAIAVWAATDAKTILGFQPWRLSSQQPLASGTLVQDILLGGWSNASDPRYLAQAGIEELSGQATVRGATLKNASLERPSAREIRLTENGSQGWVTVPLLFYHGWTAKTERGEELNIRPLPNGLAEIYVPSGFHSIQLSMPWDWVEKAGTASTGICALLSLILLAASGSRRGIGSMGAQAPSA